MIALGRNSGYQAINLAFHFGASTIALVGYDMQHTGGVTHWHGDHPAGMRNASTVKNWLSGFDALAADLRDEGLDVVNCTIETALTCFPRADLRDVI